MSSCDNSSRSAFECGGECFISHSLRNCLNSRSFDCGSESAKRNVMKYVAPSWRRWGKSCLYQDTGMSSLKFWKPIGGGRFQVALGPVIIGKTSYRGL